VDEFKSIALSRLLSGRWRFLERESGSPMRSKLMFILIACTIAPYRFFRFSNRI
jgi:hypothetical protein